jgi:hypothetical protein
VLVLILCRKVVVAHSPAFIKVLLVVIEGCYKGDSGNTLENKEGNEGYRN